MAEDNSETERRPLVTVAGRPIDLSRRAEARQAGAGRRPGGGEAAEGEPAISLEISGEGQPDAEQRELLWRQRLLAIAIGLVALGTVVGVIIAIIYGRRGQD